jgi:hypothetical protein
MLSSKVDTSKAIITATGEVIDISGMTQKEILPHINDGSWVYYEELLPRRLLLTQPEWEITSFNPKSRMVCVRIYATSGMRVLNFTLQPLTSSKD